jgi:hypothetical protein
MDDGDHDQGDEGQQRVAAVWPLSGSADYIDVGLRPSL